MIELNQLISSKTSRRLDEQKEKTQSRQRQLDHYEMQMHNVDEKYYGTMTVKAKEAEEYARTLAMIKQEKCTCSKK